VYAIAEFRVSEVRTFKAQFTLRVHAAAVDFRLDAERPSVAFNAAYMRGVRDSGVGQWIGFQWPTVRRYSVGQQERRVNLFLINSIYFSRYE